jgi:hypothetical protein
MHLTYLLHTNLTQRYDFFGFYQPTERYDLITYINLRNPHSKKSKCNTRQYSITADSNSKQSLPHSQM